MNKLVYLILPVLLWATCGFNWGFGSKDKCNDAKKQAASLAGLTGESREKQEERILKICPDGAAGHYIKGLRLERLGKPENGAMLKKLSYEANFSDFAVKDRELLLQTTLQKALQDAMARAVPEIVAALEQ